MMASPLPYPYPTPTLLLPYLYPTHTPKEIVWFPRAPVQPGAQDSAAAKCGEGPLGRDQQRYEQARPRAALASQDGALGEHG